MSSTTGTSPAAAEWTLNYPGVDFSSATVTAGPVAVASSKLVSCSAGMGSATCVLWGDNELTIANGVAAFVSLAISGFTTDTTSQVQISSDMAASSDAFPFASSATGGTVTIVQPAELNGFTCSPSSLTPPAVSTCTVDLNAAAPSGGASVGVSASLPDVSLPAAITIAQGLTSGAFTVTPLTVTTATATNLTVSYLGATEGFGLTVNPPPIALTGISVTPGAIFSGQTASGAVTISQPAGAGGVTVALSSSSPAALVPASVTVLPGATTAAFTATAGTVAAITPLVITGAYAGVNATANLTINPIVPTGVSVNPSAILSGQTASGTVTISAPATGGGMAIALSSSNAAASVPAWVTVAQGATSASFTATAGTVTTATSVALTASSGGVNMGANLTVNPIVPTSLSVSPNVTFSGQTALGTVAIAAAAPFGGITVALSSSSSAASVPSSVTVPQGATTASFTVTTGSVTTATQVVLMASYAGASVTASLTVNPPITLSGLSLNPDWLSGGQTAAGTVMISAPAGIGGIVVTLASSNNAAATVPSSVTILQGSATGSFTVTALNVSRATTVAITASYAASQKMEHLTVRRYGAAN